MSVEMETQVKETELAVVAAVNASNAEGMFQHMHSNCNSFWSDGKGLRDSRGTRESISNVFASGTKFNLEFQDTNVEAYGNTGIFTGHLVGTITAPDGTISDFRVRYTGVYTGQDEEWKLVHWHQSPLASD